LIFADEGAKPQQHKDVHWSMHWARTCLLSNADLWSWDCSGKWRRTL